MRAGRPIQTIQLELIRESSFNFFDGERVYRDLLERRPLWVAAVIDRGDPPLRGGLIKLRDLADDHWNVDTLFVLARDERSARELAELAEPWEADNVCVHGPTTTGEALGTNKERDERLVTFWWD